LSYEGGSVRASGKGKIVVAALLCLVVVANQILAVSAAGLKSGDWIRYDIAQTSQGQITHSTLNVTIQSVNGTQISGVYNRDDWEPEGFTDDLAISASLYRWFVPVIVSPGLTTGDPIPGLIVYSNDTELQATITGITTHSGRESAYLTTQNAECYWDREKGVLLEYKSSDLNWDVIDNNIWGGGVSGGGTALDWRIWVAITIVIAVLAGTIFVLSRRRRQAAIPPPPPPPPPPP
jgi:hypothetical protein